MTAPIYKNKDTVLGLNKGDLLRIMKREKVNSDLSGWPPSPLYHMTNTAFALWASRDSARETAALQDAGIHQMQGRLWALTKLWAAIKTFQERGYESGFVEMNEAIAAMQKFEAGN